jgi:hypothetical protein
MDTYLTTLLDLAGTGAIALGVGLGVEQAAGHGLGWIAGGTVLLAVSWLVDRLRRKATG